MSLQDRRAAWRESYVILAQAAVFGGEDAAESSELSRDMCEQSVRRTGWKLIAFRRVFEFPL